MRRTRWMAILMTAVLAAGSLAGCGKNDGSDGQNVPEADPGVTDSGTAGTEAAPAQNTAPEDNTITVSVQTGEGSQAGWEAVAAAYQDLHPEVEIVIDLKPGDGYDEWLTNVFQTADSTTVDIVNINMAAEAAVGKSINYGDYIDNDSPYSDGTWREQFAYDNQKVAPGTGEFNELSLDSVQVLWLYNQDIFDEVGITEVPETWDELIAVCEKIDAAGYQPIAMPGDYDSFFSGTMGWLAQIYADQTTRSMVEVYRAQEGDYCYDPDIDGTFVFDPTDPFNDNPTKVNRNLVRCYAAIHDGTYSVKTDGMKTVWSNFGKVFPQYAGNDVMFGTNEGGAMSLFYQGKAAMIVTGGWSIIRFANDMEALAQGGEIKDADGEVIEGVTGFELGSFNMPSMEGEGIEAPARTIEVATGFLGCVSKSQEHDDLVVDFLMYYSSADGMSVFLEAALADGYVPQGSSLIYGVEYPEYIANAFDNLDLVGNCQKEYCQTLSRGFAGIPESYRSFYNYCYDYLSGSIDVDQWIELHQKNIDDNFEEGMKSKGLSYSDLENPANEPTGE